MKHFLLSTLFPKVVARVRQQSLTIDRMSVEMTAMRKKARDERQAHYDEINDFKHGEKELIKYYEKKLNQLKHDKVNG